jgi:hypothetical protein
VFARLAHLDKPFIMIVPISKITTDYFQKHFANKCQVIIPRKRIQFGKWDALSDKVLDTKNVNFASVFVCYKLGLDSDLIYI